MAKQQMYQQRILKLTSLRILKSNKDLHITLNEARENDELISLADSNTIRMIDIINDFTREYAMNKIEMIKSRLNYIKKQPKSIENKNEIKKLYAEMDKIQCKMDYVAIILRSKSEFSELNKGFKINGIEYHRLVGTPNGVKKSTIIYCPVKNEFQKDMYDELTRRLNNDRDTEIKLVPAKFEAHKALACSASTPVSMPNGILVVDDLVVHFKDTIINLNDEDTDEPIMTVMEDAEVELNSSDGYGLMCPALAEKWSKDMKINYLMGAACIRNSFCKGITATFDFHAFNKSFCNSDYITDVWGEKHNINDIELILTTSMLKLWDSYKSIGDYLEKCQKNDFTFAITKVCPNKLETERNLNYQFIQSYKLSDDDIHALISPTVNEIKDVMSNNIAKTILFMKGSVDESYNGEENDDVIKSLMIEPKLLKDTYVINRINNMIKKKIDDAKIGCVKIKGNYAVIIGDPFALCQKIFGLSVSDNDCGLLKANEIYSRYWADKNVDKVTCFRAPMSCHNNIRVMNIATNPEMEYWYKYLPTVNILNCHDTFCHALNGADCDGDAIITTDNKILLNNTRQLPAIMCVQRKAEKKVINEEELIKANKDSFGDAIGSTTNKITAMYDVQSLYEENTKEYDILNYRIKCGQLYQQNCIDATKGIIAKPMPKSWYDRKTNLISASDTDDIIKTKQLNMRLLADKKPYFMNYIYPLQMQKYKQHTSNSNTKCLMLFKKTIDEVISQNCLTEDEATFIEWYYKMMPVGINPCVMNRLCWMVEKEFSHYVPKIKKQNFDYTILKSGVEYQPSTCKQIKKIYAEYLHDFQNFVIKSKKIRMDNDEISVHKEIMIETYKRRCFEVCPNEVELCDILLDLCYKSDNSKKFVWDMCGSQIAKNLLSDNDNLITYYVLDDDGEIEYAGNRYKAVIKKLEVE